MECTTVLVESERVSLMRARRQTFAVWMVVLEVAWRIARSDGGLAVSGGEGEV